MQIEYLSMWTLDERTERDTIAIDEPDSNPRENTRKEDSGSLVAETNEQLEEMVGSLPNEDTVEALEHQNVNLQSLLDLMQNELLNASNWFARIYLQPDYNRIGRIYKKAVYLQYTNDLYTEEIKKPMWLGFLGPIITANIGDTIVVHLKNFASIPYTIHPHGVRYTKANEGALYPDYIVHDQEKGDYVKPGESYTYLWNVVEDEGPTKWVDDCVVRIYHSHIDEARDVYSGLIGGMIICKKGEKSIHSDKSGEYKEFMLMFSVVNENLSWYLNDNINTYCTDPASVNIEDEDFQESNQMHSINGYMYGNLPGLSMCDNTKIKWYLFGMGNEVDIHSAYFHGQVLIHQRFHVDTLSLFPATMIEGEMNTKNPGKWLLSCQVNDHLQGGMQAIYEVRSCTGKSESHHRNWEVVRRYYIAAEEIIWNYGPTSINKFTGQRLDYPNSESAKYFERNKARIGGHYKKAVYVEYTDSSFTKLKRRSNKEAYLGILGPVIMAEMGDIIKVTFKNKASRPYSIQAHGVTYTKDMEGAAYKTDIHTKKKRSIYSQASHVVPGDTFTYEWEVPSYASSAVHDLNCSPWLYYSSVDAVKDTYSGLVGPLLVCKNSTSNSEREAFQNFFLMPAVFDENKSWYLDENIELFTSSPNIVNKSDPGFQESNMMHSINGYMYGNQPGLDMCTGDIIRWSMLGLGTEVDMHGIHFSGNTIQVHDVTRDVASVFPHISYAVIMNPDNEGVFNVECMTTDHYVGGMRQQYRVKACAKQKLEHFPMRTYYIAAEEVVWDYSPSRTWEYEMELHHAERYGDIYLNKTRTTIGPKYKKVIYREYTDYTFTVSKERKADQKHLGILGPIIMANTGDSIKIIFQNMASRPYSIYAHGILPKQNEIKATQPGHREMYIWKVPQRSGPNSHEGDCLTWAYYSTVDHIKDTYSGLIGPLVVCKKQIQLQKKLFSRFTLLFMIFDENQSWYLDDNIKTYSRYPVEVKKEDEDFIESNLKHSINGRMYANLPGLTMHIGDHVMWHLIGLGNEVDIHTAHFHAHSFKYKAGPVYQTDVFELFPGTFQTVEFIARNPGQWLIHCHVADHMYGGMQALYTVLK
ncbi:ceruloplasmin-like [Pseudophryne corroboree]|uniref:ceruloplasmin-like n=1 Tax=Pseudophryne corroboree TaxID=495146 RepID=UPI003081E38B